MATVFQAQSGTVAIWTGEQDDLPFSNPLGNLGRVKFHSSLDYPKIIDVKSFTLNLPAIPTSGSGQGGGGRNGMRVASYTLGAHGRPGIPFVVATIGVGGTVVAFTGSVPVHKTAGASTTSYPFARFVAFGFDATNLYAYEYSVQSGNAGTQQWEPRPAQSFPVTAYITDILL